MFGYINRNQSFVKILKSPTGLLFNTKVSNHIQDVLVKVCNIQQENERTFVIWNVNGKISSVYNTPSPQ